MVTQRLFGVRLADDHLLDLVELVDSVEPLGITARSTRLATEAVRPPDELLRQLASSVDYYGEQVFMWIAEYFDRGWWTGPQMNCIHPSQLHKLKFDHVQDTIALKPSVELRMEGLDVMVIDNNTIQVSWTDCPFPPAARFLIQFVKVHAFEVGENSLTNLTPNGRFMNANGGCVTVSGLHVNWGANLLIKAQFCHSIYSNLSFIVARAETEVSMVKIYSIEELLSLKDLALKFINYNPWLRMMI